MITQCRDCLKDISLNSESIRYSCSHHNGDVYELCRDCCGNHLHIETEGEQLV